MTDGILKPAIHLWTATELKSLLEKRELSCEEVIASLGERIARLDPRVRAFISLSDDVLKTARASDRKRARGKAGQLEGIPIAVKDNICTRRMKTTCASKILEDFLPPYNAHAVEKIEAAGGIILGKTNLDEFAMGSSCENSAYFPTLNPWDLTRSPGGSSGGSAAAVAAGMAPLALGSDTGGSVRQPAAMCGVAGLKPTYGRISRYGLIAFASTLDQIGPLARSVEDIALLLEIIAGRDVRDPTSAHRSVPGYRDFLSESLAGVKIGIVGEYFSKISDPETATACGKAILTLKEAGADIREIQLKYADYAIPVYYLISTSEASANLARYCGVHFGRRGDPGDSGKKPPAGHGAVQNPDILELYARSRGKGLGKEVKRRILLGTYILSRGYYETWYVKAMQVRRLIQREIEEALELVDVIVTPTSPIPAFNIGEKTADPLAMYLCDIFTVTFSLSGHPAISVPCGVTGGGLPVGIQITGGLFGEGPLLKVAYAYQCRGFKPQVAGGA